MMTISLKEFVRLGGPFMIPLIICSMFLLTIIVRKYQYLRSLNRQLTDFKKQIFQLIRRNAITEAVNYCDRYATPMSRMVKAGLLKFGFSREEIKEECEYFIQLELPQMKRGLTILATITNIAPLLGLAGTIMGFILIFQIIESHSASLTPVTTSDLARGVWQALISTLGGLAVAIPSYTAYQYFSDCCRNYLNEMRMMSNELLQILTRLHESQTTSS